MTDLSFFSYSHLKDTANSGSLPPNTFIDISKWLPEINVDSLRSEYITFASSFESLEARNLEKNVDTNEDDVDDDNYEDNEDEDETLKHDPKELGFSVRMIKLISSFGLTASFRNLYVAFKGMCTIPASSASAERKFSKVK